MLNASWNRTEKRKDVMRSVCRETPRSSTTCRRWQWPRVTIRRGRTNAGALRCWVRKPAMDIRPLAFDATLEQYQTQADQLFDAHRSGNAQALQIIHQRHPRFLDAKIKWLPLKITDAEIQSAGLQPADAQLALARWYEFESWLALADLVKSVTQPGSAAHLFESAPE